MPRAESEWTTITINKKVYEMIRRAMMESNEKAGYRKYRSISQFAEHIFVDTYAREYVPSETWDYSRADMEFSPIKKATDARALERVVKYEESQGRKPHDVSDKERGYDIESVDPKTAEVRYIEVTFGHRRFPIVLTGHEFNIANKLREKYFLYVITDDSIYIIQNPAEVFSKEENVRAILPLPSLVERGKRVRIS